VFLGLTYSHTLMKQHRTACLRNLYSPPMPDDPIDYYRYSSDNALLVPLIMTKYTESLLRKNWKWSCHNQDLLIMCKKKMYKNRAMRHKRVKWIYIWNSLKMGAKRSVCNKMHIEEKCGIQSNSYFGWKLLFTSAWVHAIIE